MSSSAPVDRTDSQSAVSPASGDRPALKSKKCRICRRQFAPRNTLQACCSPDCAITYARLGGEKRQSTAMKRVALAQKREDTERLRSRRDWVKLAQTAFNAYIRERDKYHSCICCGKHPTVSDAAHLWDAGHYRSIGAAPHLRFNEDNCHRQLVQCNRNKSGNAVEYRLGLIKRIGIERVEALENDNNIVRFDIAHLKSVIYTYRAKLKELRSDNTRAS